MEEISDKNLALEVENSVFLVFAKTQMMELEFLFDKVVEEKNEINYEVVAQKEKLDSLALLLENEKRNVEKLQLDAQNLFDDKAEKERKVQELEKDRDLAVKKSYESVKVIDELKEKIDMVVKEKDEAENVNSTQGTKILNLEIELRHVNDLLENFRNEESMMRAKVREMEGIIGLAVEKEIEIMVENSKLVAEKKEMEKSIESLTEERDGVYRTLDMVQKELENRQREVDKVNRARDEIEKVKVSCENEIVELQGEVSRLRGVADELKLSCTEFEEKNYGLLSQIDHYRNAVGEVELERDNIRKGYDAEKNRVESLQSRVEEMEEKIELLLAQVQSYKNAAEEVEIERDNIIKGYDEEKNKVGDLESQVAELKLKNDIIMKEFSGEKNKVENLELEVAGLKEKIENAAAELIKMRSEKEKVNETNKELESGLDALVTEQNAMRHSLNAIKQERDDLSAKFESSCINSKQAFELLKSTATHVCKESVEVTPRGEKKHEEEIQSFAEELEAIKEAFKVKNEMVDAMKKQVLSLQKSVSDAHRGNNVWTGISSTAILAAALTAYIVKRR
ncbi:CAP-Gly domain-containing linker protein [Trifolium repens]|nr:CAP-Gly domain-containing linker protein [Trifolium repens]